MALQEKYSTSTLPDHVGRVFGTSTAALLDQSRIDRFAQCTGDTQWIHVDVDRARHEGPFLGTIAHGGSLYPGARCRGQEPQQREQPVLRA